MALAAIFAVAAAVAETDLAPFYRGAQDPFRYVVGRLQIAELLPLLDLVLCLAILTVALFENEFV